MATEKLKVNNTRQIAKYVPLIPRSFITKTVGIIEGGIIIPSKKIILTNLVNGLLRLWIIKPVIDDNNTIKITVITVIIKLFLRPLSILPCLIRCIKFSLK